MARMLRRAGLALSIAAALLVAAVPRGVDGAAEDDLFAAMQALETRLGTAATSVGTTHTQVKALKPHPAVIIEAEKDRKCMLNEFKKGVTVLGMARAFPPVSVKASQAHRLAKTGHATTERVTSALGKAAIKAKKAQKLQAKAEATTGKVHQALLAAKKNVTDALAKARTVFTQIKATGNAVALSAVRNTTAALTKSFSAYDGAGAKFRLAVATLDGFNARFSTANTAITRGMVPVNTAAGIMDTGCDKLKRLTAPVNILLRVLKQEVCVPLSFGFRKCYSLAALYKEVQVIIRAGEAAAKRIFEPVTPDFVALLPSNLSPPTIPDFGGDLEAALEVAASGDFDVTVPTLPEALFSWSTTSSDNAAQAAQVASGAIVAIGQRLPGCRNASAFNFDTNATVDDGSCRFRCSYSCNTTACRARTVTAANTFETPRCRALAVQDNCTAEEATEFAASPCAELCCVVARRPVARTANGDVCQNEGATHSESECDGWARVGQCGTGAATDATPADRRFMSYYCPRTCGYTGARCGYPADAQTNATIEQQRARVRAAGCVDNSTLCAYDRHYQALGNGGADPCLNPDFAFKCPVTCAVTDLSMCELEIGLCRGELNSTRLFATKIDEIATLRQECSSSYDDMVRIFQGKGASDAAVTAQFATNCPNATAIPKLFDMRGLCDGCRERDAFFSSAAGLLRGITYCQYDRTPTCTQASMEATLRTACATWRASPQGNATTIAAQRVALDNALFYQGQCTKTLNALKNADFKVCPVAGNVTSLNTSTQGEFCGTCASAPFLMDFMEATFRLQTPTLACPGLAELANTTCGGTLKKLAPVAEPAPVFTTLSLNTSVQLTAAQRAGFGVVMRDWLPNAKNVTVQSAVTYPTLSVTVTTVPQMLPAYNTSALMADIGKISLNTTFQTAVVNAFGSDVLSASSSAGVVGAAAPLPPVVAAPATPSPPVPGLAGSASSPAPAGGSLGSSPASGTSRALVAALAVALVAGTYFA